MLHKIKLLNLDPPNNSRKEVFAELRNENNIRYRDTCVCTTVVDTPQIYRLQYFSS